MLFDTKNTNKKELHKAASISCKTDTNVLLGASLVHLENAIEELAPNTSLHFVTYGKWSMHQLIIHLLEMIGPSDLFMTTWSMTEQPLRALLNLKLKGKIRNARCIVSDRIIERTPEVYDLAVNTFSEFKMIKLHAKVAVLDNEQWCVAIVGSSNLTRNPRVEAGVIDTHRHVGEFHKKWILDELRKAK